MIYVFDSGPFIDLFRYYYKKRFPTLWTQFDLIVEEKKVVSVREVFNEISKVDDNLGEWSKKNKDLFLKPEEKEFYNLIDIFKVKHFQQIIRKQEMLQGKPVADPFVIAKAKYLNATVVTTEKYSENGAKVPNVCKHFNVKYLNLEEFMEEEKWEF